MEESGAARKSSWLGSRMGGGGGGERAIGELCHLKLLGMSTGDIERILWLVCSGSPWSLNV